MWLRLLALLPAVLLTWSAAFAENRVALVIGNSTYKTVTVLPNPANDAKLFTEFLKSANFEVVEAPNLSQTDLRRMIREFAIYAATKGPDTVTLIYYAGHGLQVEGENYLVPVDATIKSEADVAIEAVRLNDVMEVLAATPSKTRIVILDACRNNPFSDINRTTGRGLAIVDAPTGSVVSYSTAPGMTALDGAGANSPFTAALVTVGRVPNLPVEQAFKQVRLAVHKTTEGQQTPWESTSLTSDFSFFGTPPAGGAPAASAQLTPTASQANAAAGNAPSPRRKPAEFWRKELQSRPEPAAFEFVLAEDDVDAYQQFLALYPVSPLAVRVRGLLERRLLMMAWYTAVLVNTPLAYQAFLERYPSSDLTETARRLRDRARNRAQSAILARDMMAAAGPQSVPPPPPPPTPVSLPANLPAAGPTCSCPTRDEPREQRKASPKKPPPQKKASSSPPPRRPPPAVEMDDPGPAASPIDIGVGIGLGGFGRRRPHGGGHRPPPYSGGRSSPMGGHSN
jgi:hypothetical protein